VYNGHTNTFVWLTLCYDYTNPFVSVFLYNLINGKLVNEMHKVCSSKTLPKVVKKQFNGLRCHKWRVLMGIPIESRFLNVKINVWLS
jgi:hypothetical protein